MRLLVSACLLGVMCRYDGQSRPDEKVLGLLKNHVLVPVCPEQLGGLSTPRCPCEIQGDRVMSRDGDDRTAEYEKGALEALRLCRLFSCEAAILKAEGEAEAIRKVQQALADSIKMLNEANPNDQVVKIKALEAYEKAADGQATKIIIPSEIQSLAGLAASFKGLLEDNKK